MRKLICYLCGGFAFFNLSVIFPALMSGASADWIGQRFLSVLIFGALCFFLFPKEKEKSDKPIYENKNEAINSTLSNENKKKKDTEENKQYSLHPSPTTEVIAKSLIKIASNAIQEIISVSGSLNEKGLCEAIMFNSNIILNDPVLRQKPFYEDVSNEYLMLLYFLIQQNRTDLKEEKLINFINERMTFYSSEYNKLVNEKQYSPIFLYSTFYINPLEDNHKPCLDTLQIMTFHAGLIRMACRIHELLDKLFNEEKL